MQPVLERGSIDKPLTFDVGLIQLSFIPVCSPNTYNISVKLREGLHFSAFHSVCVSVCVFSLFWHLAQSGVQTAVSATSARYGHEI